MKKTFLFTTLAIAMGLTGCNDSNNDNGTNTVSSTTKIALGDSNCWYGGTLNSTGIDKNNNGVLDANEVTTSSPTCNNFPAKGVELPYNVLKTDVDAKGVSYKIMNGGYGSDISGNPNNPLQFYGLTDRGPNADYTNADGVSGKVFPILDYNPHLGLFELQADGSIKLIKTIPFQSRDGKLMTGLPNSSTLGGTGEIAFGPDLKILTVDPSKPYDAKTNPIKTDDNGIDSEGLAALKDGTFWVSDEYGPHIVHFDANGKEIERINAFVNDTRRNPKYLLPYEFSYRRPNRGMEGLTITPDQKTLVGIIQSTMSLPDKKTNNLDITRIVSINLETGEISQYLYRQELVGNSNCSLVALGGTSFLVLERDGEMPLQNAKAFKRVYKIDLKDATNLEKVQTNTDWNQDAKLGLTYKERTLEQVILDNLDKSDKTKTQSGWDLLAQNNIKPARKELVIDMAAQGYPHDKMEGLWLMSNSRLGIINDDDFGLNSTDDTPITQKFLDSAKTMMDTTKLYVIEKLDLTPFK
ncbi:esterase-like activity of phytase family protein [Acinetobacter sp. WU_MDCI_Axc73]|nr:esterase-like activity of phytase family protein [Acinetobacter sp. WU_MDCI_Axc73]